MQNKGKRLKEARGDSLIRLSFRGPLGSWGQLFGHRYASVHIKNIAQNIKFPLSQIAIAALGQYVVTAFDPLRGTHHLHADAKEDLFVRLLACDYCVMRRVLPKDSTPQDANRCRL